MHFETMGTIKITKQGRSTYEVGTKLNVYDVYKNFTDGIKDEVLKDYLARIPIPDAIAEIAFAQGFEYEFV